MLHFPGRIPVSIHPFFWLFAGLIGWINSGSLMGTLIWIAIILVSVLIHEFGHALTAIFFKQNPRIQLIALGGVTSYEGTNLKFWQQFLITLNGPIFGFLLFLLATFLLQFNLSGTPVLFATIKTVQIVNLFWTVVNLLPVLPLDGGQLLRIALEAFLGVKGFKLSLFIGMMVAVGFSLFFFLIQAFLIGAIFFLFAFQSFDMWRKSRFLTAPDRVEANRRELADAETDLRGGNKEGAKTKLEDIRQKSKKGILYVAATQYLALLDYREGKKEEAYEMLLPIKEQLAEDAKCILHELAFDEKNYPLVAELSNVCYQFAPSQKAALRNARAFAHLKKAKSAGGWLEAAWQYGNLNLEKILQEGVFQSIQSIREFKEFVAKIISNK